MTRSWREVWAECARIRGKESINLRKPEGRPYDVL
jgi:hypothetical protein